MFIITVPAGFPSPAADFIEGRLDLNRHLIHHPSATFFVRVKGNSMIGAGINPGDLLIVDRALEATSGRVIIAAINGELTVKRLHREQGKLYLIPENPNYQPIAIDPAMEFEVWGVVITVIHPV
ncbi:translesion error-prone DNA polymerase V autoproteolytic subunit [Kovacikia minuta CCNUW1]|uniref:LexA family protein n=1 Tax=Kovacikia minuta TaxID=2931930 RepID=UPI001CC96F04|nr:translesion error-prone DNA polymerase V autoproteolytic subunit [Kovacikia minuta]UBF24258.1 translesion error-prone DNA polymerase V autoproteolytic subunit [Kovacikia minuta CCNUW1]